MLKKHDHCPAHLLLDNAVYFITASIYKKRPVLSNEIKTQLIDLMQEEFTRCQWRFEHWVVLNDHYHIMVHSAEGEDLGKIIGRVHFKSGQWIRRLGHDYPRIWWNYWDYCPRDEQDYFVHLTYLFNNPIKHGYVTDLRKFAYSSFNDYLAQQGRDALVSQFKQFADYRNLVLDDDF